VTAAIVQTKTKSAQTPPLHSRNGRTGVKFYQLSISPDLTAIAQIREDTGTLRRPDSHLAGPIDRASDMAISTFGMDCPVVRETELLPDGRIMV
jgi:hypothetical protein